MVFSGLSHLASIKTQRPSLLVLVEETSSRRKMQSSLAPPIEKMTGLKVTNEKQGSPKTHGIVTLELHQRISPQINKPSFCSPLLETHKFIVKIRRE